VPRIDACLAADRGVDLRQQRGRHLHEVDAASDARSGKAGEVADDAAAERDHEIAALDARADDLLADALEGGDALRSFARRDEDARGADAGVLERGFRRREMMRRDVLVA